MKATLAVVSAFIFLIIGWAFLSVLLYGIGYIAFHARDSVGLMGVFQILLMWVLSPAFGGFLASYVTPQCFKSVRPEIIFTGFISVLITLVAITSLLNFLLVSVNKSGIGESIMFLVQFGAVVIGANIGRAKSREVHV